MTETAELLVATNNAGKAREISELLSGLPLRLHLLSDFPAVPEAEETGETFEENAVIKAVQYSAAAGLLTLADDSGLEVEALGGQPGVHSARYAGPGATDAERIRLLLRTLDATGDAERRARFVCVLALAGPRDDEAVRVFSGACSGSIAREPRGGGGFGYDPVFIPEGHTQTFAELPPEVKNSISHRAKALAAFRTYVEERFKAA